MDARGFPWGLLWTAVLAAPLHAQHHVGEAPATAPAYHTYLVVTPARDAERRHDVAAAGDLLTRDQMARLPAESAGELVGSLTGFHVLFPASIGPSPIASSRGFFGGGEAEYVRLVVDGVPLADVESGLADWQALRSADIERIETLRGPASPLYGDSALGGVVQLFLRPPDGATTISSSLGAWSTGAADVDGGGRLGIMALRAGAGYLRTDGFRRHGGSRELRGLLSVDVPGSGGDWTGLVIASDRERSDPGPRSLAERSADPFGSAPEFARDGEGATRIYSAASYRRSTDTLHVRVTGFGAARRSALTRTLLLVPGVASTADRETSTAEAGVMLDAGQTLGGSELRFGAEVAHQTLDTRYPAVTMPDGPTVSTAIDGSRIRLAAFASLVTTWNARVRLTPGIRVDRIADRATGAGVPARHAWSPRVAVTWLAGPLDAPVSVFAHLSRAFKTATLDQLFDPRPFPDFSGGTLTISSTGLRPQRAVNIEAGAARRTSGWNWQAVGYWMRVRDEIDFDARTFTFGNIGRSRHAGLELEADRRMGPVTPRLGYAWTTVTPLSGNPDAGQLRNIPEHVLQLGLDAPLPARLDLAVRFTRSTGAFVDDENHVPLDGVASLDFRLSRRIGRLRARLDGFNLLDDDYDAYGFQLTGLDGNALPYFYPAPGRWARVGIDLDF